MADQETSETISTQETGNDTKRASWSGKWAFILASAASAVGLGNMWRFPYLAARDGGGTFLLTYLVLVCTFGVSLLLLEAALGRKTRLSVIGAYSYFGKKYRWIGILAASVPFIITPYYCVIGGWVAKYAASYLAAGPAALADGGGFFTSFIGSSFESYAWFVLFTVLALIVVGMGVKRGIEKANLILMPLLIIMAVAIAIFTLTIPGALDGALYYLKPDFSKVSPGLVIDALGQMFYSLSLAMGIMVTYGSYMKREDSLTSSVSRVAAFDLVVSFLAGMMIVPGAFVAMGSASAVAENSGPSLMFITLPQVFDTMGPAVATVVGFTFFLLVLFAALTSAISLIEALVSIVADGAGVSRRRAFAIVAAFIVLMGCFINAGYNGLSFIQPMGDGSTLLDFFDFISNSVVMPVVAIITCVFVGFLIKPKPLEDEIRVSSQFKLAGVWKVMIKFVAPIAIAIILITNIIPLF